MVLLGVGATECSDRGRCLHLHQVLLKQFCFACRPQAGRKAKWWDIFRGNCLIRLLNYGQRHLLDFRRWETRLLSESQESLFPRCSSPWTAFGFLVRSQCHVAGEGFNPGVCTHKTLLSSCTKVCHVCVSPRCHAEIGAVLTCKGLGQDTSPPLWLLTGWWRRCTHSSKACSKPSSITLCNARAFLFWFGFFFGGEARLILVSRLTGGNPEWNYCVAWTVSEDGDEDPDLLPSIFCWSSETSCPVIRETRNLTQFRLQLALVSRTPGGGWQNWLKYWENVSLSEIIKSWKNLNRACKH